MSFQEVVNHNEDIRLLLEKGYALALDSGYLVVRDIPYLGEGRQLKTGAFVVKLDVVDKHRFKPEDHQVFFCGTPPHSLTGNKIPNLKDREASLTLDKKDLVVERRFSNRPEEGVKDFFQIIEHYRVIISGPAEELYGASALTFRSDEEITGSAFKYHDTLTSRAEIGDLSQLFKDDVIAIIGLGGSGSYVLDYMVKTPVREIRAFDYDVYHVHNAFRSPGRLTDAELGMKKAEVYQSRYDNFRTGLTIKHRFVDATAGGELEGVTFAFVCVDKGSSRSGIFDLLIAKGIPFIDVGMGLNRQRGPLTGLMRTTYYPPAEAEKLRAMQLAETSDAPDHEYRQNIQISELNSLNACIAVIRFKQLRGFYVDDSDFRHMLFDVSDLRQVGDTFL